MEFITATTSSSVDDLSSVHQKINFDDVRTKLNKMRELESTTYKRPSTKLPEPYNGLWRQQIVEWMYTLVKCCALQHSSAAAAAYFLDVAVSIDLIESPDDYQFYLQPKRDNRDVQRILASYLSSLKKKEEDVNL